MTGTRRPGHNDARGALRFLTELIAWVTVPWALWPHSIAVAIGAVVVLIGLPSLFNTPGDRPGGGAPLIAVPGIVAILLVLIQLAAATAAAWVVWPWWVATPVTVLCLIVPVTEQPRWRRLMRGTKVLEGS